MVRKLMHVFMIVFILLLSTGYAADDDYLNFTTVGDDGNTGICTGYVLKTALTPDSLQNHWEDCRLVDTLWNTENKPSGIQDSIFVPISTYPDGQHYFAIKAFDEVPNVSGLSNVLNKEVDNTPPAPVQCNF